MIDGLWSLKEFKEIQVKGIKTFFTIKYFIYFTTNTFLIQNTIR